MKHLHWLLPKALLADSLTIMKPHGAVGNEGIALWFGSADSSCAKITHLVELAGPGFKTAPQQMHLSLRAMSTLTNLAEQLGVILIGQIHSHPGRYLDLSNVDKEHGIRSPDYLSVVCPFYAQRKLSGIEECGVHVFEDRNYRRMSQDEISLRLIMQDTNVIKIKCEVPT
jgi:hypothetical protein